jgi:hypothetical protein
MNKNRKQDNIHKAHPTECDQCGRRLPKRAYKRVCATCIKREQGRDPTNIGYGGPKRKKEAAA